VLGYPTNKFAPEKPGKTRVSLRGSSSHSRIKAAGSIPFGNSKGQNGTEIHCGTMRVPLVPVA